jgi:hypothetical protein
MKLRHLFMINIVFAAFFGSACAIFPRFVFGLYGVTPQEAALWSARLVGGSILGFASLMWFGARSLSADTRKAIALALLVQDAICMIASIDFQLTGTVNSFGWLSIALYAVLTIGYAFFLFIKPNAA